MLADVPPPHPAAEARRRMYQLREQMLGRLPRWVEKFLNHGELGRQQSRDCRVYAVAQCLFRLGKTKEEVYGLMAKAPLKFDGEFTEDRVRYLVERCAKKFGGG